MDWAELGLFGLLMSSFLAATVLPFSSEAVFAAMVGMGGSVGMCVAAASLGNVAGGMTCYALGRVGDHQLLSKWLKFSPEQLGNWHRKLPVRRPAWAFFAFMPLIGEPLVVLLGWQRADAISVAIWMSMGKMLRYLLLAWSIRYFLI